MTLNGVMAVILHDSAESVALDTYYVKAIEDKPILSATEM